MCDVFVCFFAVVAFTLCFFLSLTIDDFDNHNHHFIILHNQIVDLFPVNLAILGPLKIRLS